MRKLYFTCSFDDGDIADLRLAELLIKYNVKGTFYIPQTCNLVSKSLSEFQIQKLSEKFEIGGHTMTHQILTNISIKKAKDEIGNCKKWLQDVTGKEIKSFCPPTGRYKRDHIEIQRDCGFKTQRTVEMLSYSFKASENIQNFISLPTTIQIFNHNSVSYLKNLLKRFNFTHFYAFEKNYSSQWEQMSQNYFNYINSEESRENLFFHLWGHSWEIEKYSQWNKLEDFLKFISSFQDIRFCSNSELSEVILSTSK